MTIDVMSNSPFDCVASLNIIFSIQFPFRRCVMKSRQLEHVESKIEIFNFGLTD